MDHSTFLEISFAVNVLFVSWSAATDKFVERLKDSVQKSKDKHLKANETSLKDRAEDEGYAEATTKISERISIFEKGCKAKYRGGKKVAFVCAILVVLLVYFQGGNTAGWSSGLAVFFSLTIMPIPVTWLITYWMYWRCVKYIEETIEELSHKLRSHSDHEKAIEKILRG